MITNYKIVCLVQFNKIEFESSAILALSATVVLTSLVVPVELFRDKLSESDRAAAGPLSLPLVGALVPQYLSSTLY